MSKLQENEPTSLQKLNTLISQLKEKNMAFDKWTYTCYTCEHYIEDDPNCKKSIYHYTKRLSITSEKHQDCDEYIPTQAILTKTENILSGDVSDFWLLFNDPDRIIDDSDLREEVL